MRAADEVQVEPRVPPPLSYNGRAQGDQTAWNMANRAGKYGMVHQLGFVQQCMQAW